MVGIPDAEGMPVDYEQLTPRARVITDAHPMEVRVAGSRDIVTSKTYAGRRKDAEALPELRRLLRAQESERPGPGRGREAQRSQGPTTGPGGGPSLDT
ncbi:MAG: hypothetical protein ACR2JF_08205 [Iamia sp.]